MNYHKIVKDDMLNGEGLRAVIWLSGCTHRCPGCFNQETWNPRSGKLFDKEAKERLYSYIALDHIDGVTFSGGDPLHYSNIVEVIRLCEEIKAEYPEKTIWVYTGYKYEHIDDLPYYNNLLKNIDVLVDGRYIEELACESTPWIGSTNQRIIRLK